jgi:hypothetical protein
VQLKGIWLASSPGALHDQPLLLLLLLLPAAASQGAGPWRPLSGSL